MFYPIVLAVTVFLRFSNADCFWRNGSKNPSESYRPCSNDSSNPLHTLCCADWDTCLPNGICQSSSGVYWRESCTNSDWDNGGCQELCSKEDSQQKTDVTVTPCDGTKSSTAWCCSDNTDCCTEGSQYPRYSIAQNFGDPIPTQSSSSSTLSTSTFTSITHSASESTTLPSSPSSTSNADNSSGGLSTGAKAGIGVGAAVGALALIGLGIFIAKAFHWKKKASRGDTYGSQLGYGGDHIKNGWAQEAGPSPQPIFEMQAPPRELPARQI